MTSERRVSVTWGALCLWAVLVVGGCGPAAPGGDPGGDAGRPDAGGAGLDAGTETDGGGPDAGLPPDAGGPAPDAGPPVAWDALDADLAAWQEAEAVPGMAVVVRTGGQSHIYTAGVRRQGQVAPVNADTWFQTASVTKPFTAMALLRQADRGALSLASTVGALGPETATGLAPESSDVAVGHLLDHSSGLGYPAYLFDPGAVTYQGSHRATRAQGFADHAFPVWVPPGVVHNYNNQGYSLLAHLVEETADTPFETLLVEDLLTPLGIDATMAGYLEGQALSGANIVHNHSTGVSPTPPLAWAVMGRGHGGLYLSARGVERLLTAWLDRPEEVLSPASWSALLDEGTISVAGAGFPAEGTWGPGLRHQTADGVEWAIHSGGYPGVAALVLVAPDIDLAVGVMLNCDWVSPWEAAGVALGAFDLAFPPADPDIAGFDEFTTVFDAPGTFGLFAASHVGSTFAAQFDQWDHFAELIPVAANVFYFEMSDEMALALTGSSAYPYGFASLYDAADGARYFVSRLGVGVPIDPGP